MKTIIKYISLLLFSGLILPFYNSKTLHKPMAQVNPKTIAPAIDTHHTKNGKMRYFIWQGLEEIFFPELIN
jgi:hypothetical protein